MGGILLLGYFLAADSRSRRFLALPTRLEIAAPPFGFFRSISSGLISPRISESLGKDGEIYGNAGLSFDGLTRLQVGPESPLLHRLLGCGR